MSSSVPDPLALATALIEKPSVTPADAGALDVLIAALEAQGFTCHDLTFDDPAGEPTRNLYARIGEAGPNFCFAGHTDVVPPGDPADWASDPFRPEVRDGVLYGRGAADMKCAVAAMAAATGRFLAEKGPEFGGSISYLITGDEEGDATNGTPKLLDWLSERGESIDACLVGEPTNPAALGDMVKIGRRGSMNAQLAVEGVQGHAAYPHLADNPIPRLMRLLATAIDVPLDHGNEHFPATTVAITSIDVGNEATNVIPARAEAKFNVRFNDIWSGASLENELRRRFDAAEAGDYEMQVRVSGESFLTPPGNLSDVVAGAVAEVTGRTPELSTTGGTSDARFIKDIAPVVEFGLMNATAHKVDENAPVAAVEDLTRIYLAALTRFFRDAG